VRVSSHDAARAGARLCAILGLIGLIAGYRDAALGQDGFVGVSGGRFVHNGRPFHVAGVNNHYLTFGSAAEVTRVLDDAVAMQANVVRTFIQPVIGSPDGETVPTIWNWRSKAEASNLGVGGAYMLYWDTARGEMGINEGADGLERLDFLLAEARKRDLKLLIAFLDFWAYTGGAQQMRAWYGSEDKNTFFFADPRTKQNYKDWISHVMNRVNAITGIRYKDDPTVFAWQLMNEPDIRPPSLRDSWLAEMAAHVKSVGPNHLVSSGRANISEKLAEVAIPELDFGVWHGYPVHTNLTPAQINTLIGEFCARGRAHGKPVILEEFGFARSNHDQAAVYRTWLDTIHRSPGCAGWLVWRLVSRQDSGKFPLDVHDQFDIRRDGGEVWDVLKDAAVALRARP
jgi:mannan endo-1,4-beta-mannosidase